MNLSKNNTVLGQPTSYSDTYDPSLLVSIPRTIARSQLGFAAELPFSGHDLWNCYELTWLSQSGKPMVATAQITFPAQSLNLVESKSLKLYLMSFTAEKLSSKQQLADCIVKDISEIAGAQISCSIILPNNWNKLDLHTGHATEIDNLDVPCSEYERNPRLLRADGPDTTELLTSDLLRSVCPVTGQPDYASLLVQYEGAAISQESLVRYIASLRNHRGFHEECCEMIFKDILEVCKPTHLLVACNFTRRGGIDINPMRKSLGCPFEYVYRRTVRQ